MTVTETELQEGVRSILADVLSVEPEEVIPSARFFADLGGESIDLLDASFRCEKRFGIKVQFDKMFSPGDIQSDEQGRLSPESAAEVSRRFPSLDLQQVRIGKGFEGIQQFLTVGVITDFVRERLGAAQT
jgi:acyl carrier protein